ncbi:MAG: cell division protein ZipA [Pseudomonadales bacterium]|nr:cell division protein ZipA [Pseudomonadales bacterium]
MEIGVREILMVFVGLFILGILADGFRRALVSRKNSLKVDIEKTRINEDADDDLFSDYNPELPGGTARVIRESKLPPPVAFSADSFAEKLSVSIGSADQSVIDNEEHLDFNESISMTDEPLQDREISFPNDDDESLIQEELNSMGFREEASSQPAQTSTQEETLSRPVSQKRKPSVAKDVIAINLSSRQNLIKGDALLKVLLNSSLRFGDMGLFHRIDSLSDEEDGKLFSVVNIVKPGTFDVDAMEKFQTPGICLFMTLPGPRAPRGAFETMLETAQRMASVLDCDLRDESQSALTQQTIAHYRQRIDEFCRKQMSASQNFDLVD